MRTMTPKKTNPMECSFPAEGGKQAELGGMAQCPIAEVCQSMLNHSRMGLVLLIPGLLFVLGGILILLEPTVLVWLMGCTSILLAWSWSHWLLFSENSVQLFYMPQTPFPQDSLVDDRITCNFHTERS